MATPLTATPEDRDAQARAEAAAAYAGDPVYAEEQAHLDRIFAKLTQIRDELTAQLEHNHASAAKDLRALSDEVRPEVSGDADEVMESLAAIETLNAVIDAYNQFHDFNTDKLRRLMVLLRQPYFAKVTLEMSPDRPARDVYIGVAGMTDEHSIPLIVDWRNPIAETYYNQEMGPTSYEVNGRTRTVNLTLRRQFDISRDVLHNYFDTTVAIEDSLLLGALRRQHSEKLRDITATIQREQNQVVRHADADALIVNGIAGSGKTSVMLQRIAYLYYQQRKTLSPDQIYLFSPNDVFGRYIDQVLPSMGEANPHVLTWRSFLASQGAGERSDGTATSAETLEELSRRTAGLRLDARDMREVRGANGVVLLKTGQVAGAVEKFSQIPVGPRFMALVTDELHERLNRRLAQMSRDEEVQEQMLGLDVEDQIRYLGEVANPADEAETARLTRTYLDVIHAGAHDQIDRLSWLRLDRVGMRLLGVEALDATELLWLRLLVGGRPNKDARYVMIDEAQDYTASQLMVLARHFSRAHFLLLGDQNQAIVEGTASFAQMAQIMRDTGRAVDECRLLTSYRSSPEITELFCGLVDHEGASLSSVQRAGVAPVIEQLDGVDAYLARLREVVAAAADDEGLTAVVVAGSDRMSWLARKLGDGVATVGRGESVPAEGVVLMTLRMAKGLEFDHVVVADAQAEVYPDTPLARRRLYTAISRAMHRVTILSEGPLTPLLP